jgi:hypothetical protein
MRGSVDDGEQCLFCLSTADGQDQNLELSSSESVDGSEDDVMTIDDVDDHDDEQAPAFLWESEAYHERLLACLGTAEISRIKDMSKPLQDQHQSSTTTTTKNNMFGRIGVQGNGSNQPVGRVGVGVGECMSYNNVVSFKKICKSNNTTKITTTNDNDNGDTNYDKDSTTSHVHAGHVDRQKTRVAGSPKRRRRNPKWCVGASPGTGFPGRVGELSTAASGHASNRG